MDPADFGSVRPPPYGIADAAQIEIAGPGGSVFVEIKATTTREARMSVKQVSEAVPHKDNYFLCVFASADTKPDVEAFKAKARFVTDIGHRFAHLWSEYMSMKMTLELTQKTEGGLAIELSGQQVKFRVDQDVWSAGLDFSAALDALKRRLLPVASANENPPSADAPAAIPS